MNDPSEMMYFALDQMRDLAIDVPATSSLPVTVKAMDRKADMILSQDVQMSNPSAYTPTSNGEDVVTAAGSVTVKGTLSGSTSFKLFLTHGR